MINAEEKGLEERTKANRHSRPRRRSLGPATARNRWKRSSGRLVRTQSNENRRSNFPSQSSESRTTEEEDGRGKAYSLTCGEAGSLDSGSTLEKYQKNIERCQEEVTIPRTIPSDLRKLGNFAEITATQHDNEADNFSFRQGGRSDSVQGFQDCGERTKHHQDDISTPRTALSGDQDCRNSSEIASNEHQHESNDSSFQQGDFLDSSSDLSSSQTINENQTLAHNEILPETRHEETRIRSSSYLNQIVRKSAGLCKQCGKVYKDLLGHLYNKHQGQLTLTEAACYGLRLCRCGRFCKSLPRHCPLPPSQRQQQLPHAQNLDSHDYRTQSLHTVNESSAEVTPHPPHAKSNLHPVDKVYRVLADDFVSESEIISAYNVLAGLPTTTRVWRPAESRIINEIVSNLCNSYVTLGRDVDLFRLLALPKIGLTHLITGHRLGKVTRRLKAYPYLNDANEFKNSLSKVSNKRTISRRTCDIIHDRLAQGRVRAASKILTNSLGVSDVCPETLSKLKTLHPSEPEHCWPITTSPEVTIHRDKVIQVIRSCSRETAVGPSGFDGALVYTIKHNEAFTDLVFVLSKKIAAGCQRLRQLLLGARIIPLIKNERQDIRPIAVGELFYRLVGRILVQTMQFRLKRFQFGVGSPCGVEPLTHYCAMKGYTSALVSVDIKNAFNSLKRCFIKEAVASRAPQLLPAFCWAYGVHSRLFLGDDLDLMSQSGVKQGDPLGPLLFSLGYSGIIEEIERRLNLQGLNNVFQCGSYLDDTYFIIPEDQVEVTLQIVTDVFNSMTATSGLELKTEKTWISLPSQFRQTGARMLGTHIGPGGDDFLKLRLKSFEEALYQVRDLKAQDAMLLVRQCYIPQFNHLLRTVKVNPSVWKEADGLIEMFVKRLLQRFDVADCDTRCLSLPLRHGGLGLTMPSLLSTSCYKASQQQSFRYLAQLDDTLMLPELPDRILSQRDRVKSVWNELRDDLIASLDSQRRRIFVDNSSELGSKWLHAFPVDGVTTLSNVDFVASVADRLLIQPSRCHACRRTRLEPNHWLVCNAIGNYRLPRHEVTKAVLAQGFRGAGAEVTIEPGAASQHRRADVLISGDVADGRMALDVSIVAVNGTVAARVATSHNTNHVPDSAQDLLAQTRGDLQRILTVRYEEKLRQSQGCSFGGIFRPWVASAGGTLHRSAVETLKRLRRVAVRDHQAMMLGISCTLAKFRGRCFRGCCLPRLNSDAIT